MLKINLPLEISMTPYTFTFKAKIKQYIVKIARINFLVIIIYYYYWYTRMYIFI